MNFNGAQVEQVVNTSGQLVMASLIEFATVAGALHAEQLCKSQGHRIARYDYTVRPIRLWVEMSAPAPSRQPPLPLGDA